MVKEVLIGAASVVTVAIIVAVVKYRMEQKESNKEVERIFIDELNGGEIKGWFKDKIISDEQKGIVFYPTEENTKKWGIEMHDSENLLIQMVYDSKKNTVISYREIAFTQLSPKLKELLDGNNGTIVIDK